MDCQLSSENFLPLRQSEFFDDYPLRDNDQAIRLSPVNKEALSSCSSYANFSWKTLPVTWRNRQLGSKNQAREGL